MARWLALDAEAKVLGMLTAPHLTAAAQTARGMYATLHRVVSVPSHELEQENTRMLARQAAARAAEA
jgi:hypothetical protein